MDAFAAASTPAFGLAIRVCVWSGTRLYREGLAESLGRYEHVDVVGVFGDEDETLAQLHDLRPSVILLDTTFSESMELLRAIVREVPDAYTVALALGETESEIIDWAEAGVSGYATRDTSIAELATVIERVTRGEVLCSPKIAGSLFRRVSALASDDSTSSASARLTTRERQIVELIGEGLSNKEIAARLVIELATVKNHVHNILAKLNVGRRGEAAARVRARAARRI
jgi:two-component system, NarL family, nitrate/nitrite response regulator NarL